MENGSCWACSSDVCCQAQGWLMPVGISLVQGKRILFVPPLQYPIPLKMAQRGQGRSLGLHSPHLLCNMGTLPPGAHLRSPGFTAQHCIRQAKHMGSARRIATDKQKLVEGKVEKQAKANLFFGAVPCHLHKHGRVPATLTLMSSVACTLQFGFLLVKDM